MSTAALVRLPVARVPRQAEIRLHLAPFLRQDQRQDDAGPKRAGDPRQGSRPRRAVR